MRDGLVSCDMCKTLVTVKSHRSKLNLRNLFFFVVVATPFREVLPQVLWFSPLTKNQHLNLFCCDLIWLVHDPKNYSALNMIKSNQIKSSCLSSITRGVVALSPEPEAHISSVRAFRVELKFRSAGFWGEGKTRVLGEKTLGAEKEPTTNLAHIWSEIRIESEPHRWEVSALTSHHCASPAVIIRLLSTRLIPNFCVSIPCWRGTTVSLETNPFIRLHDKRNRRGMDSK